ncbi:MAG: hypothetical protein ACRDQZ_13015, partial [Mycobacteriales bacterium]
AAAQQIVALTRPDPATVTIPDVTVPLSDRDARNFEDDYFFQKPGVSYETAFADIDTCRMYGLSARAISAPPTVVPLSGAVVQRSESASPRLFSQYGVVGGLIAGALIAEAEEDAAQGAVRRCLFYKGYRRYGTSRAVFDAINSGTDVDKAARMARIASGPTPATRDIGP